MLLSYPDFVYPEGCAGAPRVDGVVNGWCCGMGPIECGFSSERPLISVTSSLVQFELSPRRSVLAAFAVSVMPGGSSSDSPPPLPFGRLSVAPTPRIPPLTELALETLADNCEALIDLRGLAEQALCALLWKILQRGKLNFIWRVYSAMPVTR